MKIIVLSNAPELSGGAKPELIAGMASLYFSTEIHRRLCMLRRSG